MFSISEDEKGIDFDNVYSTKEVNNIRACTHFSVKYTPLDKSQGQRDLSAMFLPSSFRWRRETVFVIFCGFTENVLPDLKL
jgi:hypothetical protein